MRSLVTIVALVVALRFAAAPTLGASDQTYGPYRYECLRFPADVRARVTTTLTKSDRGWSIRICMITSLIKDGREDQTHVPPCLNLDSALHSESGSKVSFPQISPSLVFDTKTKVLEVGSGPSPGPSWPPRQKQCTNAIIPGLPSWEEAPELCSPC